MIGEDLSNWVENEDAAKVPEVPKVEQKLPCPICSTVNQPIEFASKEELGKHVRGHSDLEIGHALANT